MALAVPITALMAVVLFGLLRLQHAAEGGARWHEELAGYLRRQRERLGPWTADQVNALIALGAVSFLWLLPELLAVVLPEHHPLLRTIGERLSESGVALVAALLLFVLPTDLHRGEFTLTWAEAVRIDRGTILLFGSGMSLGNLMFSTGVARALGDGILSLTGASSLWGLTAVPARCPSGA
jgi:sodium-dependent dicarboxylate transporter 2/3/5